MDSFTRSLILLGPGTSYFDYGFSDRLFTIVTIAIALAIKVNKTFAKHFLNFFL